MFSGPAPGSPEALRNASLDEKRDAAISAKHALSDVKMDWKGKVPRGYKPPVKHTFRAPQPSAEEKARIAEVEAKRAGNIAAIELARFLAEVQEVFDLADVNGNGVVEPEELTLMFGTATMTERMLQLHEFDPDRSGSVDPEEFVGFFKWMWEKYESSAAAQEGAKIVLNEWRKNILEGAEMNKIKHRVPPLTTDVVTLRSRHARMIPGVPENMIK